MLYEAGLRGGELSKLAEARPEIFQSTPATLTKKLQLLKDIAQLRWVKLGKLMPAMNHVALFLVPRLKHTAGGGVGN